MRIEFDSDKDARNIAKHGVSLEFGAEILADPNIYLTVDTRFDYGEPREVGFGRVGAQVWVCVYVDRGTAIRMISVRKANGTETTAYFTAPR